MELVSMLAALCFLLLFAIGSLIIEYFYEIRYLHLRMVQKVSDLFSIRRKFG